MLHSVTHFFKLFFLPILSGVLAGASYIPLPPWALFFSFVPLWIFCIKHQKSLKKIFLAGWLTQFVFTLIGFNWVAYTIHTYGFFNWWLSVGGLLIFSAAAHLHIPIALVLWSFLIRFKPFQQRWVQRLALPALMSLCLSEIPMLFTWNFGYPWFWAGFPIFQTAELWGFEFISSLTLFVQLFFFPINKKSLKFSIPSGIALFALLNIVGWQISSRQKEPDQSLKVLIIQHNIGSIFSKSKSIAQMRHHISETLIQLTEEALQKSSSEDLDFILWPEGAYPYLLKNPSMNQPLENFSNREKYLHRNLKRLQKMVQTQFKTPLVTGASSWFPEGITNSLFFIPPKGSIQRYDKNKLLAFGEYIPGDKWFPKLRKIFLGSHTAFISGKEGPIVQNFENTQLGLQICYESLSDHFSRKLDQKGAEVLLNVTNDSWFGWWFEPYQHLYMTLARGIELRKPVIRSTSTGISTAMTAQGHIIEKSPINKAWAKVIEVPYTAQPEKTLFSRWGYFINLFFILSFFLFPLAFHFYKFFIEKTCFHKTF